MRKSTKITLKLAWLPVAWPFMAMGAIDNAMSKGVNFLADSVEKAFDRPPPGYQPFKWGDPIGPRFQPTEQERAEKLEAMASRVMSRYYPSILEPQPGQPDTLELMEKERWNKAELARFGISHGDLLDYVMKHKDRLVAEHPMVYIRKYGSPDGPV